mgnify:CR=1 FL=1
MLYRNFHHTTSMRSAATKTATSIQVKSREVNGCIMPSTAITRMSPEVRVRSTVGAGDSSLAGYLLAETRGLPPSERLTWAVCHGSAAASLPGTGLPLGLDPGTLRATLRRLD